MSIIFGHLVRNTDGAIPLALGAGTPPNATPSQGLLVDDSGNIYAVDQGAIAYWHQGMPFDSNSRLVVNVGGAVASYQQSIPFTAAFEVAVS